MFKYNLIILKNLNWKREHNTFLRKYRFLCCEWKSNLFFLFNSLSDTLSCVVGSKKEGRVSLPTCLCSVHCNMRSVSTGGLALSRKAGLLRTTDDHGCLNLPLVELPRGGVVDDRGGGQPWTRICEPFVHQDERKRLVYLSILLFIIFGFGSTICVEKRSSTWGSISVVCVSETSYKFTAM